jgi:tetratricopeptide (TPR) repeat protein
MKVRCYETTFGPEWLYGAEEIFVTNALIGVVAVTRYNGRPVGSDRRGPLVSHLAEVYKNDVEKACRIGRIDTMNNNGKIIKNLLAAVCCGVFFCGCRVSDLQTWTADRYAATSRAAAETAVRLYEGALGAALPEGKARDAVCVKLGRLYLNMGRFGDAAERLKGCRSPESQALLAEAFFQNGEYTKALDVFNRLGDTGEPDYLYYYAMTLEKSNLYDQALKVYRRIQNDPGFGAQARERIALINLSVPEARFAGVSPEVRSLVEKSPSAEAYPDASALYLLRMRRSG